MFIMLQTEHADIYYVIVTIVLMPFDKAGNNLWNVIVIFGQGM